MVTYWLNGEFGRGSDELTVIDADGDGCGDGTESASTSGGGPMILKSSDLKKLSTSSGFLSATSASSGLNPMSGVPYADGSETSPLGSVNHFMLSTGPAVVTRTGNHHGGASGDF